MSDAPRGAQRYLCGQSAISRETVSEAGVLVAVARRDNSHKGARPCSGPANPMKGLQRGSASEEACAAPR